VDSASGSYYSQFDHTADIGVDVGAPDLASLFETSALALFDILTDLSLVRPSTVVPVHAAGAGLEETLIRWLSELLYLHDVQGILFCRVNVLSVSPGGVSGTASGEPFEPGRHEVRTEVKAVTYHQVSVSRDGDRWKARYVVDV